MELSEDYTKLKEQIKYIENNISKCNGAKSAAAYLGTYRMLSLFFYLMTGDNPCNKKINKNKSIGITGNIKNNEIRNKVEKNLFENRDNHFKLFQSFSFPAVDIIDEYMDSVVYQKMRSTYFTPLNNSEEILDDFFKEESPELKEILDDLKKEGYIFKKKKCPVFERSLTIFNPVENKCNVFLEDFVPSVRSLSTVIHEVGHVYDFLDFRKRFSAKDQGVYALESLYLEVFSTMYQQKFYEYLIDNNINKEEATYEMINYYNNYLSNLDDSLLFSLIPDKYFDLARDSELTKKQLMMLCEFPFDEDDPELNEVPSILETFNYSYGILITANIIHDKKVREDFMNIRKGLYNYQALEDINITPDETSKKLIKNMEKFF